MDIKNILLFLTTILLLSGCQNFIEPNPIACTKIGCTDGISLTLNSSLPSTAIIEISYQGTTKTLTCAQGECIGNSAFIAGITPEQFTIKISNNGAVLHESTQTPNYFTNKPNGPDCPPDCKQTEINIAI